MFSEPWKVRNVPVSDSTSRQKACESRSVGESWGRFCSVVLRISSTLMSSGTGVFMGIVAFGRLEKAAAGARAHSFVVVVGGAAVVVVMVAMVSVLVLKTSFLR